MANAEVKSVIETKFVPVTTTTNTVVLTLSEEEAAVIYAICRCVSGLNSTTWRKHSDAISAACRDADIPVVFLPVKEVYTYTNSKDVVTFVVAASGEMVKKYD
jgi:hypothetical protein